MKIAITGSHFTPAQAVIEELKKENTELVYFGRKHTLEGDKSLSIESQILPKLGVKFVPIIAGRLQRALTVYTIPSLLKIPLGIIQSFFLVLREKPDVVLSFGGYVSVPVVISAWLLSIPVITHEQTLVSGLANTINSYFADKVAVSFSGHVFAGSNERIVTGNPIRNEILKSKIEDPEMERLIRAAESERLPILLITGGNQGSHVINQAVAGILEGLTRVAYVIHQTGDSKFQDFESLVEKRKGLKSPEKYFVKKWIEGDDFGGVLKHVDLVISRAGANTLLELAFLGVPTLVIPIPYLHKNEQMVNARYFEKLGLVQILPQSELTSEKLLKSVKDMLKNLAKLKEKAKETKSAVIPDAAKRLALETILLGQKRNE